MNICCLATIRNASNPGFSMEPLEPLEPLTIGLSLPPRELDWGLQSLHPFEPARNQKPGQVKTDAPSTLWKVDPSHQLSSRRRQMQRLETMMAISIAMTPEHSCFRQIGQAKPGSFSECQTKSAPQSVIHTFASCAAPFCQKGLAVRQRKALLQIVLRLS